MIGNEVKKGNGFRDLNTYAQGCNGYLSAENRIKYLEMPGIMKIPAHAKYQIIYDTVQKNNNLLNVAAMCEIAGVSRSGYYHYLSTEDQRMEREERDRQDFLLILKAYQYRGYHKGARSIYMRVVTHGTADSDEYQKNPAADEEVQLTVPYPQGKSLSENGKKQWQLHIPHPI